MERARLRILTLGVMLMAVTSGVTWAGPVGTAFTYQGRLKEGDSPANGIYDFQFALYDGPDFFDTLVAGPIALDDELVNDGLFTVQLDFGDFFDGTALWLWVLVRPGDSTGPYTDLWPRQSLAAVPYALYALDSPSDGGGNTLDEAYDQGGAGAGRSINAGTGDVEILGPYGLAVATTIQSGSSITIDGTANTISSDADFEFHVSSARALRIEPHATSPNLVGGYSGNSVTAGVKGATIGGGGGGDYANRATDDYGTIAGGHNNQAGDDAGTVTDANYATVSGGQGNTADGNYATVPGGAENHAGGYSSFAAGWRALADHRGAFVWADSTGTDFASTADDQFNVRASGGTRIFSDSTTTVGVQLLPGGNSWSAISDRALQENFTRVDAREILQKLSLIPITFWNLTSQDLSIQHIGPMAQDFHAAFGVGESERYISSTDADGVALAAIQGLYEIVNEKDAEISAQCKRIASQEQQIAELSARLARIEALLLESPDTEHRGAR